MLKQLREKKNAKKIWIVLCILILPAFLFWGFGSVASSRKDSGYAGKIYGRRISPIEYKEAKDAVKNMMVMRFGDNLSQVQQFLNLDAQAWERLLLLHEAKKRKLTASDKEVIELIESSPLFQRKGQFDNRMYNEILRYVFRTQARIFEEQSRQNIILIKLYAQVTDGVKVNDEEVKQEYLKATEEVSIYYAASLIAELAKELTPSEEELKVYFSVNSLDFKKPLSFNIEYLNLATEEAVKTVNKGLKKERDLKKIAKEMGLELKETGPFSQDDSIPGLGWAPQVTAIISRLKPGESSDPILLDKYYYIMRLKERKEPYIPEFTEVKDKVKDAFINKRAKELARERAESCLKKLQAQEEFNKAAKENGLKTDTTKPFKYASYIEGIGASDNLWTAAERLKEGEVSGVIEEPSGFYIIRLKSKTPLDEKKFSQSKEEFSLKLLSQKKQEKFLKFTEELAKKAQ